MMGFASSGTGSPAMCFNGHKNYVLGWYADKQITVSPGTGGAWSGKLVGFVDYTKAATSRNEYVLVVVGQLYIQYNLAEGFNSEVKQKANMVTIATAPDTRSESSMMLSLSSNQFAVIGSYTVEACAMVASTSTAPKYVTLSVRLNTQSSTCPGAALVSMKPTAQPSSVPTVMPTSTSTAKPILPPIATAPFKPATAQPTSVPANVIKATNVPTPNPTLRRRTSKPTKSKQKRTNFNIFSA